MAREVWVEMSRVLGFATDWLRSNARVILQHSIIVQIGCYCEKLHTTFTYVAYWVSKSNAKCLTSY